MRQTFYQAMAEYLQKGVKITLLTILSGTLEGQDMMAQKAMLMDGRLLAQEESFTGFWRVLTDELPLEPIPRTAEIGQFQVLIEPLFPRPRLVICGGGHIAVPLAQMGSMLDFDVTILDDRAEFANTQRFPTAQTILCAPFETGMKQLSYGENCHFVIITRGHADDRFCLEQILHQQFGYVGMIGSRRKVEVVMAEMERQGYDKSLLEQVHAPIGLKIGAQTPAEIAVCIAAEIIEVRSGGNGGDLDPEALALLATDTPVMLATILEKNGSSPRGVGAKMLADANGRLFGTVGGGAGEAEVLQAARQVLTSGKPQILECRMTNDDARKAGMVCGGVITVLLEPIL